jgi:hypothetical protein
MLVILVAATDGGWRVGIEKGDIIVFSIQGKMTPVEHGSPAQWGKKAVRLCHE